MKQRHWMNRLTDSMDLTVEVCTEPLVELAGDKRVLIEHHRGIQQYQPECICVKVKFGTVVISGCGMVISQICQGKLVISGRIDSVTLHRREG